MGKIYDISITVEEGMQVWENIRDKQPSIVNASNHGQGKPHESVLSMNVHTGTHVDAPLHMIAGGETIETIPLEQLVGPCRVLDLMHVVGSITRSDLEPFALQRGERVLFKTKSSFSERYLDDFVFLREDGAQYLAEIGVRVAATDALGIERDQDGYPTHRTLMRAGVVIVEGLRLKDVPPGNYWLVVAPLKLTGIDAAPARAFLIGD
ncbi:cyclase family protein [Cohnella zeiphila]|uniref:Kynurenine formamidase n=1 Tax=Cohnella zeiphila TaxID=2761120 RepID=A0A7X0VY06_9BACL|nr:cyclase family protein [Cohnella zeiphila]MBB6734874.1 cyclase family protein [Cohnella zeiphila]